jgi:hypothetical protein
MDLVINQFIKGLPKGCMFFENFRDISKIPLNTHLRYFSKKDNEYVFRMGGNLKNVQNVFTPTTVITLPSTQLVEEEEEALIDGLINSATGREGNRFVVLYGDGQNTPTINTINGLNESAAKDLNDLVVQKILTGMGLNSPMLAGLPSAGGGLGGNATEIATASAYYYKENVKPTMQELEDSFKLFVGNTKEEYFNFKYLSYEETKEEGTI